MTSIRAWKSHRKYTPIVLAAVMAAALPVALVSCGTGQTGTGGGGEPPSGDPLGGAILLYANKTIAQGISVPYTTPASATDLRAFRVPASGTGSTAEEIGDEVVIAPPPTLLPGEKQTFWFGVDGVPLGPYFVGIRYVVSGREVRVRSDYTITVSGIPVPVFERPASSRSVYNELLEVLVSIGDSQTTVNWRLFYIQEDVATEDVSADQLGVSIAQGRSSGVSTFWNVTGVVPDRYRLGVSVTDSGQSIAETVRAGREDRIVTEFNPYLITVLSEAPGARRPVIEVTEPATDTAVGFGIETVDVEFRGSILEEFPVDPRIDVFIDTNGEYLGGETVFAGGLSVDETEATLDTSELEGGTYYVGAVIYDGINAPAFAYAPGAVTVARGVELTVLEPSTEINRIPGEEVDIRWKTNLPTALTTDEATVEVFMRRVDKGDDEGSGPEIEILPESPVSVTSTSYLITEDDIGRFEVTVRVFVADATPTTTEAQAPQFLVVSTLPNIYWVGDLASAEDARVSGAIFEGHQFEDNAGSPFAGGEDFNNDGVDDFVIGARFAKPEFVNPSGIGVGEAYLIRGDRERYSGVHNLNKTGSRALPGLAITGVESVEDQTYGLASMFICDDVDGDETGELILGFPYVNNSLTSEAPLVRSGFWPFGGQFQSGGVVIVSSTNSRMRNANGSDTTGARLRAERVGQRFQSRTVAPEPGEGALCTEESSWTANMLGILQGECPEPEDPENPPEQPLIQDWGCLPLAWGLPYVEDDELWDTIVQPAFGFAYSLAINFVQYNFIQNNELYPCSEPGDQPYPCPGCNAEEGSGCDCTLQFLVDPFFMTPFSFEPIPNEFFIDWDCATLPLMTEEEGGNCDDQKALIEAVLHAGLWNFPAISAGGVYPPNQFIGSGFYVDRLAGLEDDENVDHNHPLEPYGCRIIGKPRTDVHTIDGLFGASITQCGRELIISAPNRTATAGYTAWPPTAERVDPDYYMDVVRPDSRSIPDQATNDDAGVAYLFTSMDLWSLGLTDGQPGPPRRIDGKMPPKPHMYLAGGYAHTGFG